MRVPRRRAGTALLVAGSALLVAGLALVAVDPSLLYDASAAGSAGSGTTSLHPTGSSPAGPASSAVRPSSESAPRATGRAPASTRVVAPPAVTLTGAAALPSVHVQPGHDTPEDAVDGFYLALLGSSPTRACGYATKPCPSFGSGQITGNVSIVDAVSVGADALVEVTGTICRATSCVPLVDRVAMPTGPASFTTSWTSLLARDYGWAGSPLPCVRDPATGQWHVKLS
jgi:hypothetical protein